jgi:hypothetical protein
MVQQNIERPGYGVRSLKLGGIYIVSPAEMGVFMSLAI